MTSASSAAALEMREVLARISTAGPIGKEPLKIATHSGRKYEVCLAYERSPNVWVSTQGARVRGYFTCDHCPKEQSSLPGGNWFQITLKNGAAEEPAVRILEVMHRFKYHPEAIEALATGEKCMKVFGSARPESIASQACPTPITFREVTTLLEKAKAYVMGNTFRGGPGGSFIYAYPEDQQKLFEFIAERLCSEKFRSNPQEFLDDWHKNRGTGGGVRMIEDQALDFFDQQVNGLESISNASMDQG